MHYSLNAFLNMAELSQLEFFKAITLKALKHICCAKHGGNLKCYYHPSAIIILSPAVLEE